MQLATARFQKTLIRFLRGMLSAWEEWINEMQPGAKRPPQ